MNEEIKTFDAVDMPSNDPSPVNRGGLGGVVSGFTDWYGKLDDAKRKALSTGLLTTGLSMMEQGGKTSSTPVSGLSVMGSAGIQGVGAYQNTIETERRDIARNKGLALQDSYVSLAKNKEDRESQAFNAKLPYLDQQAKNETELGGLHVDVTKNKEGREAQAFGAEAKYLDQRAKDKTELGGLQVGLATSEIRKNKAAAGIATRERLDKKEEAEYRKAVTAAELVAKQMGSRAYSGGLVNELLAARGTEDMRRAVAKDPEAMSELIANLNKPENARLKRVYMNSWQIIDKSLGGEARLETDDKAIKPGDAVAGKSQKDASTMADDLLNEYDY